MPADDALSHSERRFQLAVKASGSLVYEWHVATGAMLWFGDVDAALGLAPHGLAHTRDAWSNVLHAADRDQAMATTADAARMRRPYALSYRVVHSDGSVAYWRDHGLVTPAEHTDDVVFLGACSDVTAQRFSDESVRQAQRLDAIAALAGGMAHDVNNLLSIVQGYSELLREELDGRAAGLALLDEVQHAVDRTGSLTRHLLAFSRRQLLQLQPVALGPWVRALASTLREGLDAHVALESEVAADTPTVRLDPAAFEQALRQLITNACEAMPDGGALSLTTARNVRGDAVLTVRDTGRGIAPDVQPRIFEPFFTTKLEARGAGLGLSHAYGTVRQHGGTLTVESTEGAGTTCRVVMPASADVIVAPEVAAPAAPLAPVANVASGELVLVVEDDPAFATLMQRLLTDLGYTVLLASNVQSALQQLVTSPRPVQLVITDMIMPGGSGRALANTVAASHPTVPVLFMSGYSARQLERTAGEHSPTSGLLEKPFTQETLSRRVREALDSARSMR